MNNHFIAVILLGLLSFIITGSLAVPLIFLLLYFIGLVGIRAFIRDKQTFKIFGISYVAFFLYALILYLYMQYNNYSHLQSYDGINVYLPYTEELLNVSSFIDLIDIIYNTSKYAFVGSILIPFVYIGKLSVLLGGELYLPIQLVIILFAAWSSVMVYRILLLRISDISKAYKYALVYSLFSVHFMMSVYIVRDMPITLFFTILILLSLKPFSVRNIWLMVVLVLAILSLRVASGIFASVFIFLVLLLAGNVNKPITRVVSYFLISICVIISLVFHNEILSTFESKQENYLEKQMEAGGGESTIASFNSLPLGISHFVKTAYNQFMPIPSWRTMIKTSYRPESYNIMNFPAIPATYFRYFLWITIIAGFSNKKTRNAIVKDKMLFYLFLVGILFLLIQSNTMGHRRMMGVYPVFFLIALLIYQKYNLKGRRILQAITFSLFLILQLFGVYYLM